MKIKFVPYQPHCFAFGGFDLQMLNAFKAVTKQGIEVSKLDIWSRDNNFDIIHLWGISPHNYHIIDWSLKAGKTIVATVLLPYFDSFRQKVAFRKNYYTFWKSQLKYYNKVHKFIVVNEIQSDILTKYYKIKKEKISIIPNIVEEKFFFKPIFNFSEAYNISNYILCTGNISSRKNQLNLVKACINLNLNLVLIGSILEGEEVYGEKIKSLINNNNNNILWLNEMPNASEELVSAYYHCKTFVLISKEETQPISVLEAIAINKPVILLDKKYAHQKYFKNALLCKSFLVNDIEEALKKNHKTVIVNEINECRERNVGILYKNCYLSIKK